MRLFNQEAGDTSDLASYGDSRRISLLFNSFVGVIITAEVVGILVLIAHHDYLQTVVISVMLPVSLSAFWLIRRRMFELTALFLGFALLTIVTVFATYGLGIHSISNTAYPAILIVSSLVIKRRHMLYLTVYTLFCLAWLVFGELANIYTPASLERSVPGDFVSAAMIILVTALLMRFITEMLFRTSRQLQVELSERSAAEKKLEQDIALRLEAEEKIHRLNQELEERVRQRTAELEAANQELEAFAYSVSHDLRAPLRSINGFTQIIKDDYGAVLDEAGRGILERVIASTSKMNLLVDGLLDFSRLTRRPLDKKLVDMNKIVKAAMETLADLTRGRQIEWILPPLPTAMADPMLIQQVMVNLIDNAIKYTRQRAPARIEIGCQAEGDTAVYFVGDNGVGFDMQYAGKLFGVFQRLHADKDFEGTGIGLASVKRIIERHGGRIWAEAEPGQGAVFYFTLG